MKLTFDENLMVNYNSASQKIRVLSENWILYYITIRFLELPHA